MERILGPVPTRGRTTPPDDLTTMYWGDVTFRYMLGPTLRVIRNLPPEKRVLLLTPVLHPQGLDDETRRNLSEERKDPYEQYGRYIAHWHGHVDHKPYDMYRDITPEIEQLIEHSTVVIVVVSEPIAQEDEAKRVIIRNQMNFADQVIDDAEKGCETPGPRTILIVHTGKPELFPPHHPHNVMQVDAYDYGFAEALTLTMYVCLV